MQWLRYAPALIGALVLGCSDSPTGSLAPTSGVLLTASPDVPFKARLTGTPELPIGVICPGGSFPGKYSVQGNATHLGRYSGEGSGCSAFTGFTTFVFVAATNRLVAANGDELWLALDPVAGGGGSITFGPDGPALQWSVVKNITGGTGRFVNATGTVNETGSQLLAPNATAQSDIVGTIAY